MARSRKPLRIPFVAEVGEAIKSIRGVDQQLDKTDQAARDAQQGVSQFGDAAEKSADQAQESTRETNAAFRQLGITSDKRAEQMRRYYTDAYEKIANSGEASASDIQRAYKRMQTQLERVNRQVARDTGKSFRETARNVGRNLRDAAQRVSVGTAAGATGGLYAMNELNRKIIETKNSARIADTDIESFQKFAYAASTVGVEFDKAGDVLKDVNDRVGDVIQTGAGPLVDWVENIATKIGLASEDIVGDQEKIKSAAQEIFGGLSSTEALQLYIDGLEKANASQQDFTFYLEALAGDATALLPLLKNNGAELERLSQVAEENGGLFDQEDIARAEKLQAKTAEMRLALQGLGLALMEAGVQDQIISIINGLANLTRWITENVSPAFVRWGAVIGSLMLVIGPFLAAIGFIATGLGALSGALVSVVAIPAAIAAALAAVVGIIYAYRREIMNLIGDIGRSVSGLVSGALTGLGSLASGAAGFISKGVGWAASGIQNLFSQMLGFARSIFGAVRNLATGIWSSVTGAVTGAVDAIVAPVRSLIEWVRNALSSVGNAVSSVVSAVPGFASGGYTGDGARQAVAGVVHGREYVLNSRAVQRYGRPMLDAMNNMALNAVAQPVPVPTGGGGATPGQGLRPMNVTLTDGGSARVYSDDDNARKLKRYERQQSAKRSYREPGQVR